MLTLDIVTNQSNETAVIICNKILLWPDYNLVYDFEPEIW